MRHWLKVCRDRGIAMVIGTTGLQPSDHATIDQPQSGQMPTQRREPRVIPNAIETLCHAVFPWTRPA